ncbi:serine/threonine protein kinase, partial [Amycolatopsis balhimycina DSM 5908]
PSTPQPPEPGPARPRRSRRSRVVFAGTALVLTTAAIVVAMSIPPRREPASAPAQLASAPSSTAVTSVVAGPPACAARYQVVKSWDGGFQGLVTVRNSGRAGLAGWTVSWANPAGTSIDDLWNGTLVRTGSTSAITSAEWNAVLRPGETTTFGFVALARGGRRGIPVTDCRPAG